MSNIAVWGAAATRFTAATQAAARAKQQQQKADTKAELATAEVAADLQQRKAVAVMALEKFLQSDEGRAGKELLKASNQIIRFAVDNEGGGSTSVYYLGGDGLRHCVEPTVSMGNAYAVLGGAKLPDPQEFHMTVAQAVNYAVLHGKCEPEQIMDNIRGSLDAIAKQAPK